MRKKPSSGVGIYFSLDSKTLAYAVLEASCAQTLRYKQGSAFSENAMRKTYAFALLCVLFCLIFATDLTERRPLVTREGGVGVYFSCD